MTMTATLERKLDQLISALQNRVDRDTLRIPDNNNPQSRLAEALSPKRTIYGTFPRTGLMQPLAAGRTQFDFVNKKCLTAQGTTIDLNMTLDWTEIQSFVLVQDSLVSIELFPSSQKFGINAGVMEASSKNVERLYIDADVPYLLQLFMGTPQNGVDVWLEGFWAERYHTSTLTKVNPAGTPDSWTPLAFVPKQVDNTNGIVTLNQTLFGNAILLTQGYNEKLIILRNGATPVEVQVVGAVFGDVALISGYVNDPDPRAGNGAPVQLLANTNSPLISSTPFGLMQVQARVLATAAAGAQSTVEVEFVSQVGGGS